MQHGFRSKLAAITAIRWLPFVSYSAQSVQGEPDGLHAIAIARLPVQASDTMGAIRRKGPFGYPRDRVVVNNIEQVLPERQRGDRHQPTPIIAGDNSRNVRPVACGSLPGCSFTADHDQAVKRIRE